MFTKLKVYIIMFAAFAMFAGVAYWYYQDSQAALKQYAENQAKLETSLTIQKSATERPCRSWATCPTRTRPRVRPMICGVWN